MERLNFRQFYALLINPKEESISLMDKHKNKIKTCNFCSFYDVLEIYGDCEILGFCTKQDSEFPTLLVYLDIDVRD